MFKKDRNMSVFNNFLCIIILIYISHLLYVTRLSPNETFGMFQDKENSMFDLLKAFILTLAHTAIAILDVLTDFELST